VAYRETVRKKAEAQGRYVRQTGGRGQYGDVYLEWSERGGQGLRVREQRSSAARSPGIIPAVEKGIREALDTGCARRLLRSSTSRYS